MKFATLNGLHVRIRDAVASIMHQMLENNWHETDYCLDILRDKSCAHIETLCIVL
jgi:hypothetical protein